MRLLRSFHFLAFTLVFLSIVGLALAQQSVGLLLVAGALAAISWYITEGPRGRTLPRWVSNILVIAIALHALVEFAQGLIDIHIVLGRFGLWLTLIKLYERRTARDHAHLLMLSFLLMLVASLTATDLLFGLVLMAYIGLGLYVLLLYQLHASYEQAKQERQATTPPHYRLLPPHKPITGKNIGLNFRALVTAIGTAGLVLGFISFILFPRDVLQGAIGHITFDSQRSRTGFTEQIDLYYGGRITESRRPVMAVQLLDAHGNPFEYLGPLRLRGGVLGHYDGNGKWSTAPAATPQPITITPREFRPLTHIESPHQQEMTQVVRTHLDAHVLFSTYAPVAIKPDRTTALMYNPRTQTMAINPGARPVPGYQVKVNTRPHDALLEKLVDPEPIGQLSGLLRLRHEKVAQLATSVLEESGFDLDRPDMQTDYEGYWRWARDAAAILTRHLQSAHFTYTLDLGFAIPTDDDGRREDPIRYFLFEARRGHCEYFASALVALCANLDIEARLLTGYLAQDFDHASQQYPVLERNAHAWVEVRTGYVQWSAFDPTPAAALSELMSGSASLGDRFLGFYDQIAATWARSFIDFDSMSQQKIVERMEDRWKQPLAQAGVLLREWLIVINAAFALGPAGYIYVGFVTLLVAIALVVFVHRLWRAAVIRRRAQLDQLRRQLGLGSSNYAHMLRDAGFYLDMLSVLERHGSPKPEWMPPLAFADRLARTHPDIAELVREVSQLFYESRYGLRPLSNEQASTVSAKIIQLATAMGTARRRGH